MRKRSQILIVDDSELNRSMLADICLLYTSKRRARSYRHGPSAVQ